MMSHEMALRVTPNDPKLSRSRKEGEGVEGFEVGVGFVRCVGMEKFFPGAGRALDATGASSEDADMRFTIERRALVKMVERLKGERLRDDQGRVQRDEGELRLTACGAMVFVEANGVTAGCEALVMEEGTCRLPRVRFLAVLKSFAPKLNLHCGANGEWLRVERFEIRMRGYSPRAVAPEGFKPFPVTPNWLEIPGGPEGGRLGARGGS